MLSPHLLDLLRQWWREGKRRGVTLDREQLVERTSLLAGPKSVPQDAQRDTCGATYAVEVMGEQGAIPKLTAKSIASRTCSVVAAVMKNVGIDVLKLKDEVRLSGVWGKSKAHARAAVGFLDSDRPVKPTLVQLGLRKAS
jgi:hypothetical protein